MSVKLPLAWLTAEMVRPNQATRPEAAPEDIAPEDRPAKHAVASPSRRWRLARRRPQSETA
ncbi:MAG TPA: hypothetical protein VGC11_06000 [Acidimicrobiia bacterium]|jgi:hypothetical protein